MKIDPHILDLRKHCLDTARTIIEIVSVKPHVTAAMKKRLDDDLPELEAIINKSPLWPEHLTRIVKMKIDDALMKATQIDIKPSVPMANAHYPQQVSKVFRQIIEAQPPQKTDREAERLPEGHRDKKCPHCHELIYRFDKHKNRIRPNKETGDCATCKKYRDRLQKQRNLKQEISDAKRAKRKAKENRGKPDPEYEKAKNKRHEDLRSGKYGV